MHVKTVSYASNGEPSSITVKLTIREAALLAKMLGKQTGTEASELLPDGDTLSSDIYTGLSRIFNSHWEDGLHEYCAG